VGEHVADEVNRVPVRRPVADRSLTARVSGAALVQQPGCAECDEMVPRGVAGQIRCLHQLVSGDFLVVEAEPQQLQTSRGRRRRPSRLKTGDRGGVGLEDMPIRVEAKFLMRNFTKAWKTKVSGTNLSTFTPQTCPL
jgi:hypothetical protein